VIYERDYIDVCLAELREHGAAACCGRVTVLSVNDSRSAQLAAWTCSAFASSSKAVGTMAESGAGPLSAPLLEKRALLDEGGYRGRLLRTGKTRCFYHAPPNLAALMRYAFVRGYESAAALPQRPWVRRARNVLPLVLVIGLTLALLAGIAGTLADSGSGRWWWLLAAAPLPISYLVASMLTAPGLLPKRRSLIVLALPLFRVGFELSYSLGGLAATIRRSGRSSPSQSSYT
jgi:hypothetical protein